MSTNQSSTIDGAAISTSMFEESNGPGEAGMERITIATC